MSARAGFQRPGASRAVACGAALLLVLSLAACDRKATDAAAPSAPTGQASGPTPLTPATATIPPPDVGKLEVVKVYAEGHGATASDAVAEAMRLAILQVNGASVDMLSVNTKLGLDVTLNQSSASMRAEAFSDAVRQRSGGVIQNFRIVDMSEPLLPRGKFKASIEAGIAKFVAPAELKKIKLAVAPLRFDRATLPMGDRSVSAAEVGAVLRQRILDALVNTGRFAVLDRDFSPEIQQELDLIASGQAPSAEMAKLSQTVSADVLWIGRINKLAYDRHARQLRSSDRELVSYSGGWAVSQKLVNVATRQVIASESLQGTAPATAPTTLGTGVDSKRVLEGMTDELVNRVVASIIGRTFPITVVALQGTNVVLSQGGQALKAGARYAVVQLTDEIKDPQTGQSLGRIESPCCQLVVDRVTPNLSYGHLENVQGSLDQLLPGALQLREALPAVAANEAVATAQPAKAGKPTRRAAEADADAEPRPAPSTKADDKW